MHLLCDCSAAVSLHSPTRAKSHFAVARIPADRPKHIGVVPRIKRRLSSRKYIQAADVRPAVATSAWSLLLPEAAQALGLPAYPTVELALMDTGGTIWWPLLLSTLAGLSTAIGGLIAVSFSPSESTLAFLLGTAIGVMATVSGVELWWHSAVEQNDFIGITAAVAAGAVLFAVLDRLLPDHAENHDAKPPTVAAPEQQPGHISIRTDVMSSQRDDNSSTCRSSNGAGRHESSSSSMHSSSRTAADLERDSTPLLQGVSSSGSSTNRPGSSSRPSKADVEGHMQPDKAVRFQADVSDTFALRDVTSPHAQSQPVCDINNSAGNISNGDAEHGTDQQLQQQQQQQQRLSIVQQQRHGLSIAAALEQQLAAAEEQQRILRAHHAGMLRLGLLMAVTLTVHNLPEGFAVAFSAYTNIGPIMALAIALHNIPEGLVIAAPLYAATGSKLKALGMTAASGLSEPVGALLALLVFKPFVTSIAQLDYVLAVTGGVMLSVCVLELWPEGVRCGQNARLLQGIALGTVIMAWTLYIGV